MSRRDLLENAATAVVTCGATLVGFLAAQPRPALEALGQSPSPPSVMLGLGVGILFVARLGPAMLAGVCVGTFLAHALVTTLPLAASLALVKTIATWVGAAVLLRPRGTGVLHATLATAASAVATSAIVAVASFAAIVAVGRPPAASIASDGVAAFFGVFLSGLIGVMVVVPFGLGIAEKRGPVQPVSAIGAFFGAGLSTAATLFLPLGVPALFLPFPFVLFAIARGGRYVGETIVFLVSFALLIGSVKGLGPLPMTGSSTDILHMQPVVALLAVSALLISGYKATAPLTLPGAVLNAAWAIAALITGYFDTVERERDEGSFDRTVQAAQASLSTRMAAYEDALRAGVGFFVASKKVSRGDWTVFVRELGLLDRYPGLNSFGVAVTIPRGAEEHFITKMREEVPDFVIRDAAEPDTSHPERFVMIYREPMQTTPGVLGLDFATDVIRREAAIKARATNAPALSRVVRLARGEPRFGFLMFAPIPSAQPGWVYASFEVKDLFNKTFGLGPRAFHAEIHDSAVPDDTPVFADPVPPGETVPSFSRTVTLVVAQQPLTVIYRPTAAFLSGRSAAGAFAIASGGLIALLLAAVTGSLQMIGLRAGVLAEERTRELAARERLLQALMQAAPVGIFLTDDSGKCTYVNDTLAALLGLPPATALGNGWLAELPPSYRAQPVEHRLVQPNGREIWAVTRAIAMRGEDGGVSGYVGTVQDLTEIKKQQRELIATSKMSSLGEMAGGIAHEINNPLTIIQGRADQLIRWIQRGVVEPDKVKAVAQDIDVTVHRIAKIVKGLRVFARDAERDPFEETPLAQVIDSTLVLCQERFKLHGVDLKVVIEPGLTLECRPVQLSQVLLNLLNNAFDAVEGLPSKWVEVRAARREERVELAVTDSGAGLPSPVAARVMQPFFTTKPVGKGTGLGLSIAKGLVEDHGGVLGYDAASPHTRFVVTLPVSQPADEV